MNGLRILGHVMPVSVHWYNNHEYHHSGVRYVSPA